MNIFKILLSATILNIVVLFIIIYQGFYNEVAFLTLFLFIPIGFLIASAIMAIRNKSILFLYIVLINATILFFLYIKVQDSIATK